MDELLEKISHCVEFGKTDRSSPYPPDMKGQEGADELAKLALESGIKPGDILDKALIPAMSVVGDKFSRKVIYVPQMLMAAKAMSSAMKHLKPFFQSGETKRKGKFIIGTVAGDLHDIGKNLVSMMIEGGGWEVIDLGVDVNTDKFLKAIAENPDAVIGLSALLTTTMENMKKTVAVIREKHSGSKILVGGAPVTMDFCLKIGADFYSPDPQGAVNYLSRLVS
ncbi:MAG TPA: corrinoid protein [Bacteroidales bacterium]|jgi:5-methyltetrahydrofolate--homocysteine methyltransferase|nr:cobalamin-binding protein [Bacteroidales bacterium]OQB61794.1 MAG: Methionine synthase [Bacteroidetes bacterium ADurb.Bin145]HNR43153.1 corrinoid protein [Bacteroidales bacterium]HOU01845.1 corrinoid protein [Bacteroidales bacterium]HQG63472.1 corrinoid protein [Bacteroidales bacterium]